jgi:ABC-type sugar transport system ATPase subunit
MQHLVRGLAEDGRMVLVFSTDLTELAELCDRVAVFQHGRIVATLSGDRLSEQR